MLNPSFITVKYSDRYSEITKMRKYLLRKNKIHSQIDNTSFTNCLHMYLCKQNLGFIGFFMYNANLTISVAFKTGVCSNRIFISTVSFLSKSNLDCLKILLRFIFNEMNEPVVEIFSTKPILNSGSLRGAYYSICQLNSKNYILYMGNEEEI